MRTSNSDNVYDLTCKVTGNAVSTTPVQFRELVRLYNSKPDGTPAEFTLSSDEVKANYVSRAGRNQLKAEKLTPVDAKTKYSIHDNVLAHLKCFKVKPLGKRELAKLAKKLAEDSLVAAEATKHVIEDATALLHEVSPATPTVAAPADEVVFVADDKTE